jgi:hypothetical protein
MITVEVRAMPGKQSPNFGSFAPFHAANATTNETFPEAKHFLDQTNPAEIVSWKCKRTTNSEAANLSMREIPSAIS